MAIGTLDRKDEFVGRLNDDEEFSSEMRWFDGSIAVTVGSEQLWLKIYRGQVIDSMDHTPVFGATIGLAGSEDAWSRVVSGELTFSDAVSAGSRHLASYADAEVEGGGYRTPEIQISGNGFEAGRVHVGLRRLVLLFAETYRRVR